MEAKKTKILEEILSAMPELRPHEGELRALIDKFEAANLHPSPDPDYLAKLKNELLSAWMPQCPTSIKNNIIINFIKHMSLQKITFIVAGAAIIVLALLPLLTFLGLPSKSILEKGAPALVFTTTPELSEAGISAFGKISLNQNVPAGRGGGGNALSVEASKISKDFAMPAPAEIVEYKYVYKGDPFELPTELPEVLRRKKGLYTSAGSELLSKTIRFGQIDFDKFSKLGLQNLTLAEDREFGYMLYFDLLNGSLSISENYEKWQSIRPVCAKGACPEPKRIKYEDVPSDDAIIKKASDFAEEYQIDLASFGEPSVQNDWRKQYEHENDKANFWIPDTATVVYPYMIGGSTVYDESGNPYGLSININLLAGKVSGVWNLYSQNYEKSAYSLVENVDEIKKYAEQGGFRNYYYATGENTSKMVEVELGTPVLGYMQYWNYTEGKSEELAVPAYIFPIVNKPENGIFWKKNVVVPLLKELLEDNNDNRPMPLMMEGASGQVDKPVSDLERTTNNLPAKTEQATPAKRAQ